MVYKNTRIFVADDDGDILNVISLMLQTQGYTVTTSNTANELFQYGINELPNIILLDIWMGGKDGREVYNKIRNSEMTKNIPIIFISAHSNIDEIAAKYGANGFIAKPFEMKNLLTTISDNLLLTEGNPSL